MDNYIVSARKYRPSTFRSVVGQKALVATLKNAVVSHKLAHAYLFCGPRGVGKTTCARIFAKTINCLHPTADGEACNECESCISFNEQRSFNIHELDAASNNSVDDIRELIDQVRISPQVGKYKVYIIDEVHMLSSQAFNAFLKTLEEPPHYAIFVLATTEKHKILPTILSRCQIYDFSRISINDTVEHLAYVAEQEHITAEPEALNVIAQKADGGMRDALSIFDQVSSYTSGNITYQATIDNLNVLDYEYYFRLTSSILSGNVSETLLIFNEILTKGFEGNSFVTGLASHFRDLLVCKDEQTIILFDVGASIRERYLKFARECPIPFLYKAIELTNECDLNYRVSRNKKLLVELLLIRLCQLLHPSEIAVSEKKKIEPLANQTPVSQPAPPIPSPQKAEVKTSVTQIKTATAPDVNKGGENIAKNPLKNKLPQTISLHGNVKAEAKTETRNQEVTIIQNKPYTAIDLEKAWISYAESLKEKAHLRNSMINCKPSITGQSTFEVAVHNKVQENILLSEGPSILGYLRQNLQNGEITMSVRLTEANEKQLAYTSAERFNLMAQTNSALLKLKDEFDLILD
ncbi:MAG: DNA polymerase III subunit gamma/tau [Bacteroidales bacterium]|nr:DNA polymerase III subunit gamma/tau [Bacteroidales bacterium]